MQVYFIDNEDYFQRKSVLKDNKGKEFDDNDERAVFFARGVLETVIKLRWAPDLIHCHGWLTSLVPFYIKTAYHDDPLFVNSKVVLSVYNENLKRPLNPKVKRNVAIDGITEDQVELLNVPSYENMVKLGITHSDAVIQGSEHVSSGLSDFIRSQDKLFLEYQSPENYIDAYNDFYEKIF
jgi:starch synthase